MTILNSPTDGTQSDLDKLAGDCDKLIQEWCNEFDFHFTREYEGSWYIIYNEKNEQVFSGLNSNVAWYFGCLQNGRTKKYE